MRITKSEQNFVDKLKDGVTILVVTRHRNGRVLGMVCEGKTMGLGVALGRAFDRALPDVRRMTLAEYDQWRAATYRTRED